MMLLFRQTAMRAGAVGYLLSLGVVLFAPQFRLQFTEITTATVKGFLTSIIVAYVLLAGLAFYHLMRTAGAIDTIASALAGVTRDRVWQALILVMAFSPFFESATGFGIAIVVIAPILLALGFPPQQAAVLGLLGQNAVPWGTLAIGTMLGAELSGVPLHELGVRSALATLVLAPYYAVVAVVLVAGWRGLWARLGAITVVAGTLAITIYVVNAFISVELAGLLGGATATLVAVAVARLREHRERGEAKPTVGLPRLTRAALPYGLLVCILLLSRLVHPIETLLRTVAVLRVPSYSFELPLLYSPAFWLLVCSGAVLTLFPESRSRLPEATASAFRQWYPASVATLCFVCLAHLLYAGGATRYLADLLTRSLGSAFELVSPVVGALAGFMTGSNTSSNAMFIQFQTEVARQLRLDPATLAAAQNIAASNATLTSPSRVILATAVTDLKSHEGTILRWSLPVTIGMVAILVVYISLGLL